MSIQKGSNNEKTLPRVFKWIYCFEKLPVRQAWKPHWTIFLRLDLSFNRNYSKSLFVLDNIDSSWQMTSSRQDVQENMDQSLSAKSSIHPLKEWTGSIDGHLSAKHCHLWGHIIIIFGYTELHTVGWWLCGSTLQVTESRVIREDFDVDHVLTGGQTKDEINIMRRGHEGLAIDWIRNARNIFQYYNIIRQQIKLYFTSHRELSVLPKRLLTDRCSDRDCLFPHSSSSSLVRSLLMVPFPGPFIN